MQWVGICLNECIIVYVYLLIKCAGVKEPMNDVAPANCTYAISLFTFSSNILLVNVHDVIWLMKFYREHAFSKWRSDNITQWQQMSFNTSRSVIQRRYRKNLHYFKILVVPSFKYFCNFVIWLNLNCFPPIHFLRLV